MAGGQPKTVVVTGAGGFLGTELVKQLLDTGFTVRATVRKNTPANTAHLETLAAALPGKLEIHEADISTEGSFDKVVQGAIYVFHVASPVTFGSGDPERDQREVIEPAVRGTTSLVKAAAQAKSIKRVVLTSSTVAVRGGAQPVNGTVYTEEDWNTTAKLEKGQLQGYQVSKVQAERAAWELAAELGVDLVTINPTMITGPVTNTRGGFSVDSIKNVLEGKPFEALLPVHVDVRDVARAHILAAQNPAAKGRYVVAQTHPTNFKEVSEALKAEFPDIVIPDAAEKKVPAMYGNSKAEKELGLHLITPAESFVATARTLLALGLAKPVLKD